MFPVLDFKRLLWPMRVTARTELPNELWFEIFKHLSRDTLRSVHGVSSLFHAISHPLFFRDFVLDPDRHDHEFIQRLNMYSSAPIANHVRKLCVSFRFGRWFRRDGRSFTSPNSPNPLLVPLLQAIPCFQNLRILECSFRFNSEIHFANLGLQALPSLQELHIHGGKLYCPHNLTGSKIRVVHFFFTAIPEIILERRREGESRRSFLSILDPETLRSLTLSPSYDCSPAAWLAYDRDLFATFRNLSSVNIGCDGPFLREVHTFLVQLPALQHLTLTGSHRRFREFAPSPDGETLSSGLQSYTGPCEYIPIFLRGTSCTRLAINACCTPDELRDALEDTSCTGAVRDISLRFSLAGACGWKSPQELFALLPLLISLELGISDSPA
ncbi:F-box domain-containing protein [Mycena sanguinolenta]|uniref:F-box domain-containing protein n=1 Tax=Mycena sanguinolenta TaxID=230812 RepID=A0A8H7CZX1_9AGAR|nr:F-box domain-containing protein [Mycena sanguinolenta]